MKTIEVTDEVYDKLMELSKEIVQQDHRYTRMPYMFQVQTKEKVWDSGLNGDTLMLVREDGTGEIGEWTEETVRNYCTEHGCELPENIGELKYFPVDDFDKWLSQNNLIVSSYSIEYKLQNAFFTAKGCKEHIERNHYHYNSPTDFLSHCFRNPEMELVYTFLCGLQQKNIHT